MTNIGHTPPPALRVGVVPAVADRVVPALEGNRLHQVRPVDEGAPPLLRVPGRGEAAWTAPHGNPWALVEEVVPHVLEFPWQCLVPGVLRLPCLQALRDPVQDRVAGGYGAGLGLRHGLHEEGGQGYGPPLRGMVVRQHLRSQDHHHARLRRQHEPIRLLVSERHQLQAALVRAQEHADHEPVPPELREPLLGLQFREIIIRARRCGARLMQQACRPVLDLKVELRQQRRQDRAHFGDHVVKVPDGFAIVGGVRACGLQLRDQCGAGVAQQPVDDHRRRGLETASRPDGVHIPNGLFVQSPVKAKLHCAETLQVQVLHDRCTQQRGSDGVGRDVIGAPGGNQRLARDGGRLSVPHQRGIMEGERASLAALPGKEVP
mmetsp:Transcript_104723/g.305746  ORF Transcript_104723/g.305746 Transcript_104723/m.305746 type:complete len:376 (-) Transcript_104723:3-1130(-)